MATLDDGRGPRCSSRCGPAHCIPVTATVSGWWPKTKQAVVGDRGAQPPSRCRRPPLVRRHLQQTAPAGGQDRSAAVGHRRWTRPRPRRSPTGWRHAGRPAPSPRRGLRADPPVIAPGGRREDRRRRPGHGTYHVTEVEHTYSARGFETRFTAGDRRPVRAGRPCWRGEQPSSFRQDGLVVGIVTTVGNAAGLGRATSRSSTPSLGDEVESNWARVVTARRAAPQRGMTFLPEVNDEVHRRLRGRRRAPAGDPRRAVQRQGRRRSSSASQNSNGQQAPDHLPARPLRRTRRRHRPGQPAHRAEPGRRHSTRCGWARTSSTRPCRPAPRSRSSPATRASRSATTGRSPSPAEDHPQGADRRGDLRREHHREGRASRRPSPAPWSRSRPPPPARSRRAAR